MKKDTYLRSDSMTKQMKQKTVHTCIFCDERFHEYKYWGLRKNDFPYDTIAEKESQCMLYLIRHDSEPNEVELREFGEIKKMFKERSRFTSLYESLDLRASIPDHYHVHLFNLKRK